MLCHLFGYFAGKYVQITGLKAPGDYSNQFWSDKILVLLCEGPKPPNSMVSGFLDPSDPLFLDLNRPEYFKHIRKVWKHFRKILFL